MLSVPDRCRVVPPLPVFVVKSVRQCRRHGWTLYKDMCLLISNYKHFFVEADEMSRAVADHLPFDIDARDCQP